MPASAGFAAASNAMGLPADLSNSVRGAGGCVMASLSESLISGRSMSSDASVGVYADVQEAVDRIAAVRLRARAVALVRKLSVAMARCCRDGLREGNRG